MPYLTPIPSVTPIPTGVLPRRDDIIGFQGTVQEAANIRNDGDIFYINNGHALANDDNDGTDPAAPMSTLAGLIARTIATNDGTGTRRPIVKNFDTIVLQADLTESVSIVDWTTVGQYVNLMGIGQTIHSPTWFQDTAGEPCLVLGAVGWSVSGIRFLPPVDAAAIVLPETQAPYGALALSNECRIVNNYFYGAPFRGLIGINLHGAPPNIEILNNLFAFINNAGGTSVAIASTNSGFADAYRTLIHGNRFQENDLNIDASLNVGQIDGNIFSTFGATDSSIVVDLRGGTIGENMVVGNNFGDADYSNVGGFWANAANPGGWSGNSSDDVAEAEVGDNGMTIGPPA